MTEKLGREYQVTKYFKSAPAVCVGGFKSIQDLDDSSLSIVYLKLFAKNLDFFI